MLARWMVFSVFVLAPLCSVAGFRENETLDDHGFPLPEGALRRLGDLRFTQPEYIRALAVSSDGKFVASAGAGVYLWNAEAGRLVRKLETADFVVSLAFSRDDQLLAATTRKGKVKLWKVQSGELHWPPMDPEPAGGRVRFLDSDRLLAVAAGVRVELRDVAKGSLVKEWGLDQPKKDRIDKWRADLKEKWENYEFGAVTLSPSGQTMAWLIQPESSNQGANVKTAALVYDTVSGRFLCELRKHRFSARAHHLLDDGTTLLLQGYGDETENVVIDMPSDKERFRLPFRTAYLPGFKRSSFTTEVLSISHDSRFLFTGDEEGNQAWDIATGKELEWGQRCNVAALSANGKHGAISQGVRWIPCDGRLKVLNTEIEPGYSSDVAYEADGRLMQDYSILWDPLRDRVSRAHIQVLWDIREGKIAGRSTFPELPRSGRTPCDWDRLGRICVYHKDKRLAVRYLAKGEEKFLDGILLKEDNEVWSVVPRLSYDTKRILVSSPKKEGLFVQWFESRDGREMGRALIPSKELFNRHYIDWVSEDGSEIGYTTWDGRLKILACKTGKVRATIGIRSSPAPLDEEVNLPGWEYRAARFGQYLFASRPRVKENEAREFAVFDIATGKMLRRFHLSPEDTNEEFFWNTRLSPDGRFFAVHVRQDNEIDLVETATRSSRGKIRAPASIESISIAPDSRTLATSHPDSTILLWDLQRPLGGPPLPEVDLRDANRKNVWKMLGDPDRARAEPVIWALVKHPDRALALLKQSIKPIPAQDPKRVHTLIAQLDSDRFKDREAAMAALRQLGDFAVPALYAKIESATLEQVRRIEKLLQELERPDSIPECLAELRAIEVLENIGSPQARSILETLSSGAPEALLTSEARLAAKRLTLKTP